MLILKIWHKKSTAGEHLTACHGLNDETVDEKGSPFLVSSVSLSGKTPAVATAASPGWVKRLSD